MSKWNKSNLKEINNTKSAERKKCTYLLSCCIGFIIMFRSKKTTKCGSIIIKKVYTTWQIYKDDI